MSKHLLLAICLSALPSGSYASDGLTLSPSEVLRKSTAELQTLNLSVLSFFQNKESDKLFTVICSNRQEYILKLIPSEELRLRVTGVISALQGRGLTPDLLYVAKDGSYMTKLEKDSPCSKEEEMKRLTTGLYKLHKSFASKEELETAVKTHVQQRVDMTAPRLRRFHRHLNNTSVQKVLANNGVDTEEVREKVAKSPLYSEEFLCLVHGDPSRDSALTQETRTLWTGFDHSGWGSPFHDLARVVSDIEDEDNAEQLTDIVISTYAKLSQMPEAEVRKFVEMAKDDQDIIAAVRILNQAFVIGITPKISSKTLQELRAEAKNAGSLIWKRTATPSSKLESFVELKLRMIIRKMK